MNILAIGAHFDDLELGCGGTLARHVRQGDRVIVATNSGFERLDGNELRPVSTALEEGRSASKIIGYQLIAGDIPTFHVEYGETLHTKLLQIIERNQIDLIYTHWINDVHHDHRNAALATLHVSRHVNKLLMYRSNWYPSEKEFHGNFYVDITDTWSVKEQAILAYESEHKRVGDSWLTYFRQEAANYGLQIGKRYAECFQTVRWVI